MTRFSQCRKYLKRSAEICQPQRSYIVVIESARPNEEENEHRKYFEPIQAKVIADFGKLEEEVRASDPGG